MSYVTIKRTKRCFYFVYDLLNMLYQVEVRSYTHDWKKWTWPLKNEKMESKYYKGLSLEEAQAKSLEEVTKLANWFDVLMSKGCDGASYVITDTHDITWWITHEV